MADHPITDDERRTTIHGRWELTPLGSTSWRICDVSRRHADADCLVAYLDRTPHGTLEALWLRAPRPATTRFTDLTTLFRALDLSYGSDSDRSKPPVSIAHRPPL